jgi:hypothetical protein
MLGWANEDTKNRIFLVKVKRSKLVHTGDTQWKHSANKHVLKIKETSVKIPGVQLPEPLESAKITGVYTAEADDKIPGVDMVQEQDVDVDLDFAPANEGSTK